MYLLYEFHRSPEGKILVTDILMSSFYPGHPKLNWQSSVDKALFEFCKNEFKKVIISERNYDPDTKIWSFFNQYGKAVHDSIKNSPLSAAGVLFQQVDNLAEQVKSGKGIAKASHSYNPDDFFYQQSAPVSTGPSIADVKTKLASILMLPSGESDFATLEEGELKKLYRKAALRLHPDRNNGDAKGMTELNYLWQVYNSTEKVLSA